MVLEISATPSIFTFKLWDWGRLGLDGLPRPINIGHGSKVIQWERQTEFVRHNLINQMEMIAEGDGWREERSGLNDIYYGREKQAYELLDALGCRYRKGQAGLFVWAELPEGYEGDSFAFSDEVMEKTDVFLTPGGIFGSEGNGYIRITLCCPEALLKKATEKIKAAFGK